MTLGYVYVRVVYITQGWPTCLRLGLTRKFLDNSRSTSPL